LSALERKILEIVHADNRRGRRSTLATIEIALEESNAKRVGNSVITKACWDLERLGLLATVKPTATISAKGSTVIGKPVETPAPEVAPEPEPVQAEAAPVASPEALPTAFARIEGETKLQTTVRLLAACPDGLTAPEVRNLTGLDLSGSLSHLRNVDKTVLAFYREGQTKLTYKLLPAEPADDASPGVAPATDARPEAGPATAEEVSAVAVVAPVAAAAPTIVAETHRPVADAIGLPASWGAVSDLLSTLEQLKARIAELEAAACTAEQAVTAAADGWIREVVLDLSEALGVNVEATDPCVAWTDLLDEARRRKPVHSIITEARRHLTAIHEQKLVHLAAAADILGVA
jgi:hypothetical protein